MILFCDTSALIKLYVQEEGSELMLEVAKRGRSCRSLPDCLGRSDVRFCPKES